MFAIITAIIKIYFIRIDFNSLKHKICNYT